MFSNVGGKLRVIAIIFFVLLAMLSVVPLVYGIILGTELAIVIGAVSFLGGFLLSLVFSYVFYGYGTLIRACEENAKTNRAILELLENDGIKCLPPEPPKHGMPPMPSTDAFVPPAREHLYDFKLTGTVQADNRHSAPAEEPASDMPEKGEEKTISLPRGDEPAARRCLSCGNVVKPDANFCNQCGQKMN